MTISIQANAAGTAGQINIGATPVVNIPVASGLPFCKNKLFNGEVTRINQRGFDGNWAAKNSWASGNTIAQQELCYGWDMWAKASATDMLQPIEAGNFRPSTVHTISGIGVTTQQITSPASGNWNITVPQTARNIQVEEGSVATPFEIRPISFELALCQRYYETCTPSWTGITFNNGDTRTPPYVFNTTKRVAPYVTSTASINIIAFGEIGGGGVNLGASVEAPATSPHTVDYRQMGNFSNIFSAMGNPSIITWADSLRSPFAASAVI